MPYDTGLRLHGVARNPANGFPAELLASFFTWAAQQELESIRRRTKAGLENARANGKTLGTPRKMTDLKVEMARSFRRDGLSFKQIGTARGVSRTTVARALRES